MSDAVQFHVPGIPQGKGRARATTIGGKARLYTPGKTVAYEAEVARLGKDAMAGAAPFTGPLALTCEAVFVAPKSRRRAALAGDAFPHVRPDGDNIFKACADGLNGIAYRDDAQICDGRFIKRYGETPGVWVTIQPYAEIA